MFQNIIPGWRTLLLLTCLLPAVVLAQGSDLSGKTDASISNVLVLVANHQIAAHNTSKGLLTDGNYAPVYTTTAASAATKPKGIEWEYGWGVTLYGLLQARNATGDTNFESYVINHNLILARYYSWLMSLKNTVTNGTLSTFYNTTVLATFIQTLDRLDYCGSMTAALLEGALTHTSYVTNEQVLMAQTTANWVNFQQSRLPDGTLWRPERFSGTIWADDLYMSCPFLIRWWQHTGNTNYLNDAARQVINQAGYLQDTNGIWYHGYYLTNNSVNGQKWGRANGWILVTTAEILSVMPTNHPARSNLLSIFTRHVEGLKTVQAASGMWRQILDNTNLWEETSCTAMFGYAIARGVNRGWLDATNLTVVRRAFAAICTNISATGVISNICVGTSIDRTLAYYQARSRANDDQRGVGAVMLVAAELLLRPQAAVSLDAAQQATLARNAGLPQCRIESSTNLADWSLIPDPPVTNWQITITEPFDGIKCFRLRTSPPAFPPPPLEYEAESLAFTTNGAVGQVSTSDTNASGNYFISLSSTAVSNHVEFTLPNIPAGNYRLKFVFKSAITRARCLLAVDGLQVGGVLDQYWPSNYFPIVDYGPVNIPVTGDHAIRLTVSGKSPASTGYTLTADKFIFAPQ